MWWARLDLNQRPIDYESTALTTELRAHTIFTNLSRRSVAQRLWLEQFFKARLRHNNH